MNRKIVLVTGLLILTMLVAQQILFPIGVGKKPPFSPDTSLPKQHNLVNGLPEADNESRVLKPVALSTLKEGWGFRKNGEHQIPEITTHQKSLVDKYGVYFVADTTSKGVVLTFDLGYEKGYTKQILDILHQHKSKAIFFVTGPWLKENPDLAKRMVKEGHIIGNHTWSHPSLPTVGKNQMQADIKRLEDKIVETTGQKLRVNYLRPPMGEYSEQTLHWTNDLGYKTVLWSIALKDWMPMGGADKAVTGVLDNLHNGAIILLHGVSQDVTEGLDQILTQITAQGYQIIPINQVKPKKL
ncbi:MAG: polysaccharide deacetylase family protein [Carboxydocellales bacterium]